MSNVERHYNFEFRMWNVEWAAPESDFKDFKDLKDAKDFKDLKGSKDAKDFPVEYHKEGEISRLPLLVKP